MPDYFNPRERNVLFRRIEALAPDAVAKGSIVTGHQTICHLSHTLREFNGESPATGQASLFTRTLGKWLVFSVLPWPEKLPRAEAELADFLGPVPLRSFEADHAEFIRLLQTFETLHAAGSLKPHPKFGNLSGTEWGRYLFLHMDFHLAAFGIHGDYLARA